MRRERGLDFSDPALDLLILVAERSPEIGLDLQLPALPLALDLTLCGRGPGVDGPTLMRRFATGSNDLRATVLADPGQQRDPPELDLFADPLSIRPRRLVHRAHKSEREIGNVVRRGDSRSGPAAVIESRRGREEWRRSRRLGGLSPAARRRSRHSDDGGELRPRLALVDQSRNLAVPPAVDIPVPRSDGATRLRRLPRDGNRATCPIREEVPFGAFASVARSPGCPSDR
jgi:hypothetical protein